MLFGDVLVSNHLFESTASLEAESHYPPPYDEPDNPADAGESLSWEGWQRRDAKILIVDDEPSSIRATRKLLRAAGYTNLVETTSAVQAAIQARQERADVVLLDVVMPEMNGTLVVRQLRLDPETANIPVIVLAGVESEQARLNALAQGATDFLIKPVEPTELALRVRNALLVKSHFDHLKNHAEELERQVRQRTAELAASRLELIHCLARAAEFRDNETGRHVIRVGRTAGILARELGLPADLCELIELAAPLHDLGKIGIPDAVLLKPGRLDADEMELMQKHALFGRRMFEQAPMEQLQAYQSHTRFGEQILQAGRSPVLEMASRIALTHHEKWDGSGYPLGLAGEDIPIEGRITAVADVFDALSSKRPYKPAFPLEKCFGIMEEGRGKHFDPRVLDAFFARRGEIVSIRLEFMDVE